MQPAYYEDFKEIKKKIWSMLNDAVTNRSSQFRIPVFVCGDQNNFDGRIVVLRKSDQSNNLLQFHSDIRSDKIPKLKNNKNASMLFYDKEEKIQVRLKVECIVNHNNEITKEEARRNVNVLFQIILHYRTSVLTEQGPPHERIVVFDEAQRMWDQNEADKNVLININGTFRSIAPLAPPLKPNQPNHKINAPNAAIGVLLP